MINDYWTYSISRTILTGLNLEGHWNVTLPDGATWTGTAMVSPFEPISVEMPYWSVEGTKEAGIVAIVTVPFTGDVMSASMTSLLASLAGVENLVLSPITP